MNTVKIYFTGLTLLCLMGFAARNIYAQSPVPDGAVLELLENGLQQAEGPIWVDGTGLLFSDIKANRIYQWSPVDSTLTTYLNPSDSSNGLTLDGQGRLLLTQMAKRRVSRQESGGTITPLVSTYTGKKFNSPNDLVVKSDGSVFFTDPDFNTPAGQPKEMGFKGIFRISPTGTIKVLDSTTFLNYTSTSEPNGICFSPDETKLYVNDSPIGKIYVWDVENDSVITNKAVLYTIPLGGYADGMKVDPDGNLYCAGPSGVWVISPSGVCVDTILVPENPSNCAWGDADRKTLYITTNHYLFRIRLTASTGVKEQGFLPPQEYELYNNYPNPFNPNTKISYQANKPGFMTIKIFDALGCEITTLVNKIIPSGIHSVQWNASGAPSGIYFCQLKAGSFKQTKKLVLIK